LGLDAQAGIILVATEWFSGVSSMVTTEEEEKFIRHTLRALRQFPSHQVVVKLHPSFQAAYERIVRAVAKEEGIEVTIAKEGLWDLLALCEVVVISGSTVGLEAMILGRPVVVVHAFEGVEEIPYVASGAALGAASHPEEIATAVEKALHDGGTREAMARAQETFVPAYAHRQDGLASERVAQLIQEIVRGTPS
jgi:lipid A disaccharide synthetase